MVSHLSRGTQSLSQRQMRPLDLWHTCLSFSISLFLVVSPSEPASWYQRESEDEWRSGICILPCAPTNLSSRIKKQGQWLIEFVHVLRVHVSTESMLYLTIFSTVIDILTLAALKKWSVHRKQYFFRVYSLHMPWCTCSLRAGETLITDRTTAGGADDVHKRPRYEHLYPWI